ncbi:hypothetical protein ACCS96_19075 [Rhizobium ruizarguesonis]
MRVSACGCDDIFIKVAAAQDIPVQSLGSTAVIGWATEDCRALALS